MFGYATDETEECMPLTIILAHKLNARMAELRRSGVLPWLRPDSKTQVSLLLPPSRGVPDTHWGPRHPSGSSWYLSLLATKWSVRALKILLVVKRTIYPKTLQVYMFSPLMFIVKSLKNTEKWKERFWIFFFFFAFLAYVDSGNVFPWFLPHIYFLIGFTL